MSRPVNHMFLTFMLLCIFCVRLFSQEPSREAEPRYAVMDFAGTSEFPHANQPTMGPGFGENSPAPPVRDGLSKSNTRFVLIADTQDRSLQIFFDMSLWKYDSGLDPLQSLWYLKGDEVTNESSWNRPVPSELIWSIKTGSTFVDLFDLPVDGGVDMLVGKIAEHCNSPRFGTSASTSSGTIQRQRVVEENGNQLILNESNSGQIVKSLRAERSSNSPNKIRCVAIIYMNEKPVETIDGELTLSHYAEIPAVVTAWKSSRKELTASGASPLPAISSGSSSTSAPGRSATLPEKTRDWTGLFMWASAISLMCVLFGRYFLTLKKRNQL